MDLQEEIKVLEKEAEGMSVELPKLDITNKDTILSTLKEFVGGKASCIWMSQTLPWDLNLPMTTPFPRVPGLLQLFVLCAGQPPLLLTLCDEEEDVTDVKVFTKDTSSLLHWSLLDFCVLDFAILPCTMTHAEFSLASLTKAIREVLSIMKKLFTSPLHLDAEMFSTLKSATRAQTGATFIPCFLDNPNTDKVWVFLMHKRWRNIVSILTEQIHKEQRLNLFSSNTNAQSNLNVVLLEVAKRLGFSEDCEFKANDDTTRQCINRLKEHFFQNFDVTLLMNDWRESSYYTFCVNQQDGSNETDIGQGTSDNKEPQTQSEADVENSRFVPCLTFRKALTVVEEKDVVVLCGPPGSGKTAQAHAIIVHYKQEGYKVYNLSTIKDLIEIPEKSVVLMDGTFGQVRVDREEYDALANTRSKGLDQTARKGCKLIFTAYPHVLRELQTLEQNYESPFPDPSVIVRMAETLDTDFKKEMLDLKLRNLSLSPEKKRQLVDNILLRDKSGPVFPWCCDYMVKNNDAEIFDGPIHAYVPLLTRMLSDPVHGNGLAAAMSLAMTNYLKVMYKIKLIKEALQLLGFDDVSKDDLTKCVDCLKGFILSETADGFSRPMFYDAVGLALAYSNRLPTLLRACDTQFLVQYIATEEASCPCSIPAGADHTSILIKRIYDEIITGQAPQICQHSILQNWNVIEEICAYSQSIENGLEVLLNAKDNKHHLPLLYWSLWSSSDHLTRWCLQSMMKHVTASTELSETLLSATIMIVLCTPKVPDTKSVLCTPKDPDINSEAKVFMKSLALLSFKPLTGEMLKLSLPLPNLFLVEKSRKRSAELKTCLQSWSKCYLGDPSLPIPATLLSVTVTEDAVSVELPSQHWYLALRLLADREVDETDRDGNTLLHLAAHTGHLEAITMSVKSGASLGAINNRGETPLELAQRRRKQRVAVPWRPHKSTTELFEACKTNDIEKAKILLCEHADLKDKGDFGDSPLHLACRSESTGVVSLLLDLGADPNIENTEGSTPVLDACVGGFWGIAKQLLESGGNPNAQNSHGERPLHLVSKLKMISTSTFLIMHGADIDAKDDFGRTPLHCACESSCIEIAECLLSSKAYANSQDSKGETPLHYTCKKGDMKMVNVLLNHPLTHINARDCVGSSALHVAAEQGEAEIAKILIEHQANIDLIDNNGCTALRGACSGGHSVIVQLLLAKGANINAKSKTGFTALHACCKRGHADIVRLLVSAGNIEINAKSERDGLTPLHLALKEEVVEILLQHGADPTPNNKA